MVGESESDENLIAVGDDEGEAEGEDALTGEGALSRNGLQPSISHQQCTNDFHHSHAELVPFDPSLPALHAYLGGNDDASQHKQYLEANDWELLSDKRWDL